MPPPEDASGPALVRTAPAPCACLTAHLPWEVGLPAVAVPWPLSLAAQHHLDLGGCRDQLIGLSHGEHFARLGFDLADEVGQIRAGRSGIARVNRAEGIPQLRIQARLQPLGELEAVNRVDQGADLRLG